MAYGFSAAFQKLSAHLLIGAAIVDQNAHRVPTDEKPPTLARRTIAREVERLHRHGEHALAYSELNDSQHATGSNEDGFAHDDEDLGLNSVFESPPNVST
jgi:hypothetical protein